MWRTLAVAWADGLDDWCRIVTNTRAVALCSDPELRRIAADRQRAFDATRARLTAGQKTELLADQVARYGADVIVIDWASRLRCSACGGGDVDFVVSGAMR